MSTVLNPNLAETTSSITTQDPALPVAPAPGYEIGSRANDLATGQSHIGSGLCFIGEFTGSDPLFIDGKVEGTISLPGGRVTVGRNGWVDADIEAGEIVVKGRVRGNVSASDRVDICREGSVTGELVAARLNIEEGAIFNGGIDIRRSEAKA